METAALPNKQHELEQIVSVHFACIHVFSGCDPQMRTTAQGHTQLLSDHSDPWVPCASRQAKENNNDTFFLKHGKNPLHMYLKPVCYHTEDPRVGRQFGCIYWIGWHTVNDFYLEHKVAICYRVLYDINHKWQCRALCFIWFISIQALFCHCEGKIPNWFILWFKYNKFLENAAVTSLNCW